MNSDELDDQLGAVSLIAFDVDGVLTDGRFYLSDDGVESKAFSTQDGYGIRRLIGAGVHVAVISGRRSGAVERRMAELGVIHVYLGCSDKVAAFEGLRSELGIASAHSAFAGDDVPDIAVMRAAGVAIAVANAHSDVQAVSDFTTERPGGHGAVREICDLLLNARDRASD